MVCDKEAPAPAMFHVQGDLCVTASGQLQEQGQDSTWAGQGRAHTDPGEGHPREQARAEPKCTKEPLATTDPCSSELHNR